ncbi:MAG TPA: hypothetical protein VJ991_01265 [Balneolales bacterium]|nr:hypothetical protein [Balneolales bacterium]
MFFFLYENQNHEARITKYRAAYIGLCVLVVMFFQMNVYGKSSNIVYNQPEVKKAAKTGPIDVTINLNKTYDPINRFVYGQFIENLSNWFEGGLWSEMLGDRKFFYPVNNSPKLYPRNSRSGILGRWRPLGPEQFVTMDSTNAFVGKYSPKIITNNNSSRGIQQSGLPLVKGKSYTGHIILAGDPGVKVTVSLVWGDKASERQSISINALTSGYQNFPFKFTSQADTKKGCIEITGKGSGSFTIGTVSLMPADNINGFRPDLIKLLKNMHISILRWGGNHSSGYNWRDGIGNRDTRPPTYDYAWHAVVSNDVGTDEYMTLCRLINAEPYIGVNAGFGDAYSAAQWVQYVNGPKDTPMGKLRAMNGHPEPYHVKWWGIGNEMYGSWQLGHMALNQFVIKNNIFAKKMRKADPSIILIASGATPYEIGTTARFWPIIPHRPIKYGSRFDWDGGLIKNSFNYFNYLAEHFYPLPGKAFNEQKQKFVKVVDDPLVNQVRRPANRVEGAAEAWQKYKETMPKLKNSSKRIVLDEWVAGASGLQGVLGDSEVLNEIFRHTDTFNMSAHTGAPGCLTYNGTESQYRGIGLVFKLYSEHFGKIPVQVHGNQPQHPVRGTIGVDKPEHTSGSATYPLDIMAALSKDHRTLTIAVVNPTKKKHQIKLSIDGGLLSDSAMKWIITGPDIKAKNVAGKKPEITLRESTLKNLHNTISSEPISLILYRINLEN